MQNSFNDIVQLVITEDKLITTKMKPLTSQTKDISADSETAYDAFIGSNLECGYQYHSGSDQSSSDSDDSDQSSSDSGDSDQFSSDSDDSDQSSSDYSDPSSSDSDYSDSDDSVTSSTFDMLYGSEVEDE